MYDCKEDIFCAFHKSKSKKTNPRPSLLYCPWEPHSPYPLFNCICTQTYFNIILIHRLTLPLIKILKE